MTFLSILDVNKDTKSKSKFCSQSLEKFFATNFLTRPKPFQT